MIEASVVVPHYDDTAALAACIAALERQSYPRDRFEIVVADNNSPVGLAAVAAVVGDAGRIVLVTEPGAGPARNGGAAVAVGRVLAFTDCDCLPEPGWLAAGLAALKPGGFVGGAMTVLVADESRPTPVESFERAFAFANERYVRDKGFTVTANLFVARDDFARVGGFRTGVSEDLEWCQRARALGLAICYAPDAVVGHPARRNWDELVRKWRRLVREAYLLNREKPLGRLRWLARSWLLPASALAHLPAAFRAPGLSRAGQRWDAARTMMRLRLWRFAANHRVLLGGEP